LGFPPIIAQVHPLPVLVAGMINVMLGLLISIPFIWKEARLLIRL